MTTHSKTYNLSDYQYNSHIITSLTVTLVKLYVCTSVLVHQLKCLTTYPELNADQQSQYKGNIETIH